MALEVLTDVLNPMSAIWCWSTPNRFEVILELMNAFHIGKKEVIAILVFHVAIVFLVWLFISCF